MVPRYLTFFQSVRAKFPSLKIDIINVSAKEVTVLERAAKRALVTKRFVPNEVMIET